MTKRKLSKNADISPSQSPHDGIHTCSKGCKKPGCNRGLRDEIESLKAELDRLKKTDPESVTDIDIQADPAWAIGVFRYHRQNDWAEIERLKAENERLINAGDKIASIIQPPAHGPGEWDGEWDMWKLAKDNKYL